LASTCRRIVDKTQHQGAAINSKLATYLVDVKEEGGALIAHLQGTVYRGRAAVD
jgi:acyl-coenzyme A thioesterase PaaI-like protein